MEGKKNLFSSAISLILLVIGTGIVGQQVNNLLLGQVQNPNMALLAGMGVFVILVVFFLDLFKLNLGKLAFIVVNLVALAFGTVLGTFVLQGGMAADYTKRYGVLSAKIIKFLSLNDVFHSFWYVALVVLLIASLLFVSFQKGFTRKNLGYHLTHLGLVVIVVGFWADFLVGYRGMMDMTVGETNNVVKILQSSTGRVIGSQKLDFDLKLNRFESEKHDPDYKVQIWKSEGERPEVIAAIAPVVGKTQKIHRSDISFTVKEFFPNYTYHFIEDDPALGDDPSDPVLLGTYMLEGEKQELQLRSAFPKYSKIIDPINLINLNYVWELGEAEQAMIDNGGSQGLPLHEILVGDSTGIVQSIFLKEGVSYPVMNTKYKLRLTKFFTHLLFDDESKQFFNASEEYKNPAAQVEFIEPNGTHHPVYLYAGFDGHESGALAEIQKQIGYKFLYNFLTDRRTVIEGKTKKIFYISPQGVESQDIVIGESYPISNNDIAVSVTGIFPNAKNIKAVPVKKNDDLVNPMAIVEVHQDGKEDIEGYIYQSMNPSEGVVIIPDSKYFLSLGSTKDQETKFWKSEIAVIGKDGSELKKQILEVNHPMSYGGFMFYQSDFDPKRPAYSGIGVSKAPGLYVVYLGFFIVVFGLLMVFYFQTRERLS